MKYEKGSGKMHINDKCSSSKASAAVGRMTKTITTFPGHPGSHSRTSVKSKK